MKGVGLRDERCRFTGSHWKRTSSKGKNRSFYSKGDSLWEKGVNSIEKISPLLVISYQFSVVSGAGSLEVWKLSERIAVSGWRSAVSGLTVCGTGFV